jgi:hypothetical protein
VLEVVLAGLLKLGTVPTAAPLPWKNVLTWKEKAGKAQALCLQISFSYLLSGQTIRAHPPALASRYTPPAAGAADEVALVRVRYGAGQVERVLLMDMSSSLRLPASSRVVVDVMFQGSRYTGATVEAVLVQSEGTPQTFRPPTLTMELSTVGAGWDFIYSPPDAMFISGSGQAEYPCAKAAELVAMSGNPGSTAAAGNTVQALFITAEGALMTAYADDSGVARPLQILPLVGQVAVLVNAHITTPGGVARVIHYLDL